MNDKQACLGLQALLIEQGYEANLVLWAHGPGIDPTHPRLHVTANGIWAMPIKDKPDFLISQSSRGVLRLDPLLYAPNAEGAAEAMRSIFRQQEHDRHR